MLVTEYTSDGRRIVRLHRDWTPDRISKAYTPLMQRIQMTPESYRLQTFLLSQRQSNH